MLAGLRESAVEVRNGLMSITEGLSKIGISESGAGLADLITVIRNNTAPIDGIGKSVAAVAAAIKPIEVKLVYPLYASGSDVSLPYSVTRYYAFEAYGGHIIQR